MASYKKYSYNTLSSTSVSDLWCLVVGQQKSTPSDSHIALVGTNARFKERSSPFSSPRERLLVEEQDREREQNLIKFAKMVSKISK